MTSQLKQDLIAARNFLATHTWGQGQGLSREVRPSYCAAEALRGAVPEMPIDRVLKARMALDTTLGDFPYTGGVVLWNDQKGRTKEEVLALYDRAIEATE